MTKFQKGQSGNLRGRPRGTSHASKLREAIESDLSDIIDAVVKQAKNGDTAAAKLLLDRAIPTLRPQQEPTEIVGFGGKTLSQQGAAVVEAMGAGKLSPEQAQAMLSALASLVKIAEFTDLESRLTKLEERAR